MMTQLQAITENAVHGRYMTKETGAKYSVKSSHQGFIEDFQNPTSPVPTSQPASMSVPSRETIKHTLIGSSKAVTSTIAVLHQLGYAQVGDWSPLLPSPTNPGEVMSILVRSISVQ